jgi:hypothetical protein
MRSSSKSTMPIAAIQHGLATGDEADDASDRVVKHLR